MRQCLDTSLGLQGTDLQQFRDVGLVGLEDLGELCGCRGPHDRAQLAQMKKMGGMASLLDKLPAQFQQAAGGANMDQADKQVRRMCGIIDSMTPQERAKPELIKATRKRRIAAGAGVQVQEVNRMLAQYEQMNTMMKKFKGGGMMKMMRGMKGMMPGLR